MPKTLLDYCVDRGHGGAAHPALLQRGAIANPASDIFAGAGGRLDLPREDLYRGRAETEAMSLRSKKKGPDHRSESRETGRIKNKAP
jgi:hypothetical protein